MTFEAIVEEVLKLSVEEKKQVIMIIIDSFIDEIKRTRKLSDFEGVGERLRDDTIDAKDEIRQMRDEWDDSP